MIRVLAAGWLIAFVAVGAIPLGSLAWLMIHRLTGGHWGDRLQPTLLDAAAAMPLLIVAFLPVVAALPWLYPWLGDAHLPKQDVAALYLNVPAFVLRTVIGLVGWSLIAWLLPRMRGPAGTLLAGIGLIFYAVTITLLSTDWILSAEPPFISESFGVSIAAAQMLAALAYAALAAPPLDGRSTRDLAGLTLALCLAVTYLNFMAVLVIWYGDLPDKVFWFVERLHLPWNVIAVAASIFGTALPILALIFARVRMNRNALRTVAGSILFGLVLYDTWLLAPAYGAWSLVSALVALPILFAAFAFLQRWPPYHTRVLP